ncbi:hypothetical protein CDG77_28065 [Nostoc sp. 'Peltigera membranacea cyanobiont' 213]|nr:hypothetical protein CDG77_28065 [Nostoc sp. 'Peltigera membranacea cyanobiont' 213]
MTKNIAHNFEEKGKVYVFYLELLQKFVFAFCIIFRYFLVFWINENITYWFLLNSISLNIQIPI